MPLYRTAILIILIALAVAASGVSSKSIAQTSPPSSTHIILGSEMEEDSFLYAKVLKFYRHLFEKVGRTVEFKRLQYQRARHEMEVGALDGQYFRVEEFSSVAPTMLRVNEPLASLTFGFYAHKGALTGIEQLSDILHRTKRPLTIGYARGTAGIEASPYLPLLKKQHRLITTTTQFKGLTMLAKDRLDLFIASSHFAASFMAKNSKLKPGIKLVAKLSKHNGYIYLHKKHVAIIPLLEQALRDIKQDGSYEAMMGFPPP